MDLRTAIFIIPPKNVQLVAEPLRLKYWPDSQARIAAHISILSPFVSFDNLPDSTAKLELLCKDMTPYEVELDGYGEFPGYIFMKLTNTGPTQVLYSKILSIFPECSPYEGKFGTSLHPHVSVGNFANHEEQELIYLSPYKPLKFIVDKLHIMFTDDKMTLPWKLYKTVDFNSE